MAHIQGQVGESGVSSMHGDPLASLLTVCASFTLQAAHSRLKQVKGAPKASKQNRGIHIWVESTA